MGPITIFHKSAFQAVSAAEHLVVFKHLVLVPVPRRITKRLNRHNIQEVCPLAR